MTRYIFKITAKGTDRNKLFKGEERTRYAGKCYMSHIYRDFAVEDNMSALDIMKECKRLAQNFGYSTMQAAENYLKKIVESHNWESSYGFNTFTEEIIAIEV